MNILIIAVSVSAFGMIIIIGRHIACVRRMGNDDFASRIIAAKSLRKASYNLVSILVARAWNPTVRVWLYKNIENGAKKSRTAVLKIEKLLLRFTNYIKGKHEVEKNGNHSEYWNGINNFKNGLDNKEEEK